MGVGIGLLAVGVAFAIAGFWWYRASSARFAAARHWTQGEAVIDSAHIHASQQMVNDTMTTGYRPVVAYRYHAGGAERSGTRVFLCKRQDWGRGTEADAWVAAHQPGARMPLWFDPANPDDAALVLNKTSIWAAGVIFAVGVFLLAMGVVAIGRAH